MSHDNNIIESSPKSIDIKTTIKALCNNDISQEDAVQYIYNIQYYILLNSLTSNERQIIWSFILAPIKISPEEYISMQSSGPSVWYDKIRSDTFRTFAETGVNTITEASLIRVLNTCCKEHNISYQQGQNIIAAVLLSIGLDEVKAYNTYCNLLLYRFPTYWKSSHIGVQAGCTLVEKCLLLLDPTLYQHLNKHNLQAYIYAYAAIQSLSAVAKPLTEVFKVWDFLLTFGVGLNVLCVVVQILSIRDKLVNSNEPNIYLNYRNWPTLKADYVIKMVLNVIALLPKDLIELIMTHVINDNVVVQLADRLVE